MWQRIGCISALLVCSASDQQATAADPPLVEKYLHSGQLAEGEKELTNVLRKNPVDDQVRFGLGALQFLRGVEHLAQSLYRYGVRSERGQRLQIPFVRLPVPTNPKPDQFTYADSRAILQKLIEDLQSAENTLGAVRDEQVKLPLHLGPVRLDPVGDGKSAITLAQLLATYMQGGRNLPTDKDLLVKFDRGDVAWFRGYCHLLMALAETALAYDGQEVFDCAGHIFFTNVKTPHNFLRDSGNDYVWDVGDGLDIVDVISLIHVIRMPVKEPARLKAALTHLERMLALSKESWKYILAETDDDHEWIPNPRQTGVFGVRVSQQLVDSWLEFVDETEAILAGKRLVPFWRGKTEMGVNLRRAFTDPRPFDLVLWVQGPAATPYLEKGPLTRPEVWTRLQRVFGGEFIGFALWFN
jgi:hypothetical protein